MRRTLHLHFAKFAISSELDLASAFDRLYADNDLVGAAGLAPSRSPSRSPFRSQFRSMSGTIELTIDGDDVPDQRPPEGAVFAETNLCAGRCHYADGTFTAAIEGDYPLRASYDVAAAAFRARLSPRFRANPQAAIGRVVRPFLQSFLLPLFGLKAVHAAAVARGGRGTLLVGAGGAGKTTTAIALAEQGYTLLSDDGPLVTMTEEGTVLLSSLDYVHATDATIALFPRLRPHVVGERDHRAKYAIARRAFDGDDRWRAPVPVRTYVELRRLPVARPIVVPLRRPDVLSALVRDSMIVFRHRALRQPRFAQVSAWTLECLGSLVAGAQAFRLEFADAHLADLPGIVAGLES